MEVSNYTKYTKTKDSEGDGRNVLEPSDDVAAIILGGTWRMPTRNDFIAMMKATYWKWDADDKGYYVYAPDPAEDAGKFNEYGKGDSYVKTDALLFFPAAGKCAARLSFACGMPDASSNVDSRCCGFSVRPVASCLLQSVRRGSEAARSGFPSGSEERTAAATGAPHRALNLAVARIKNTGEDMGVELNYIYICPDRFN